MSTGETVDGEVPKTIVLDMVPLLDDPYVRYTSVIQSKQHPN